MLNRAIAAAAFAALIAAAPAQDGPFIAAAPSKSPISLDGRLDEPAWREAAAFHLVQQSPRPGEPTPFLTEARVIRAGDRLYIGIDCRDPDPRRVAVHSMRRDDEMEGDDTVTIVLDTYGDKRTGYWFRLNAAGARADGLISDPEHPSYDWDGVWDARAARHEQGWAAEIVIPARTLSFTPGLGQWGLNLERAVPREGRVVLRWASPTLDSFLYDLSRAGTLAGMEGLEQGRGLEFSPYAIGRMKSDFSGEPRVWQSTGGFDFTWKATPQLVTVFTYNTDFAETEVDARQINLTRFPLFFPEKRAFFLEGANQYEFGLGLGESFIPFFSRQIGLLDGQPIPIDAGFKLNGRVRRWNLALLDVQTRRAQTAAGPVPAVNLLAGRVSYDLTGNLRVGALFTNGDPRGAARNALLGFDAVWRTSKFRGNKNLLLDAWAARSFGDLGRGSPLAWGLRADYPNDLWDCATTLSRFGPALNPALGFLPRPGTRQLDAGCSFKPRPSGAGRLRWIRQEFLENEVSWVVNAAGVTESWGYFFAPVNVQFATGDRFEFNYNPQYEYLAAPFEIAEGVRIPRGGYRFDRFRVEAESSPHRRLQGGIEAWFGRFYGGTLTQWEQHLNWTALRGKLQLGLAAEHNFGRLPQGALVQRLWQFQTAYAWNPNLVLTSFVQYDSESRNLGTNTRLRWTPRPGNDLFLVWNRGWQRLLMSPRDLILAPQNEMLAVKLRWTFRY